MKKTYSLLFCILLAVSASLSLHAAPVTPDQAMDIAKKIFSAQSVRKSGSSSLKLIWDGEEVATKATQPAFYVIARDGGGFGTQGGDVGAFRLRFRDAPHQFFLQYDFLYNLVYLLLFHIPFF